MAWWVVVRPSEAERPSGLISLTTGRTPEPLNPGLHSVRSQPPGTHPRGALTALVFWLDLGHIQSQAVHDPPNTRLNWVHKYSPGLASVRFCFLRCSRLIHAELGADMHVVARRAPETSQTCCRCGSALCAQVNEGTQTEVEHKPVPLP